MGFNRRKMEAQRKAQADAEAAARRGADTQVSAADAERLITAWNERGPANALAVRTDDRRRGCDQVLLPADLLPGLPHNAGR
jgi:hypothetical protein